MLSKMLVQYILLPTLYQRNLTVIFSNKNAAGRGGDVFWRTPLDILDNSTPVNNSADYGGALEPHL